MTAATSSRAPRSVSQTLFFDADDTLWENNIYFERAIAAFISYLDHRVHTPEEVRGHLNTVERATTTEHGYGLVSFRRSLVTCFEQLTEVEITPERRERILGFAGLVADQEIELLPTVAEAIPELASRHRLILVTKGDTTEQTDKLMRSGLAPYFSAVEVLREKDESAYRRVVQEQGCDEVNTWMIGNSPKSDINPALAAGLNAIFVPHDFTWVLEHETVNRPPDGRQLLEVATLREVAELF